MQQATHPIVKDLVLIGGGHSHAIVLRMHRNRCRSTPNTDYEASDTLILDTGHVAGFYSHDECHIDLVLGPFAQAQLYIDRVDWFRPGEQSSLC